VEPVAKPSAQGRSEIFPALNRLLTPEGNVRAMATNPGMEPPYRASPLNRLFASSSQRPRCSGKSLFYWSRRCIVNPCGIGAYADGTADAVPSTSSGRALSRAEG
jgi:hypothetical protein